ncbi:MAG: phospholipase [Bacteroidota bacterium]|nr:phospholipase [Bacteroidota bacterium]
MIQKNISIPKTARYFQLGEPSAAIDTVWFVCHGYGQLASYFLEHFKMLENGRTLIIAPEGLHRFYWEKFSGRVVASWMTKEDRNEDIQDYVNFLDAVYEEVINSLPSNTNNLKVNVLGFSQGTATVSRWLSKKNSKADNLILWAGTFPDDLGDEGLFNSLNMHLVTGTEDPFVSAELKLKQEKELTEKRIRFTHLSFQGKHEIHSETLAKISETF